MCSPGAGFGSSACSGRMCSPEAGFWFYSVLREDVQPWFPLAGRAGELRPGAGAARAVNEQRQLKIFAVPFAPRAAASLHTLHHRGAEVSFTD